MHFRLIYMDLPKIMGVINVTPDSFHASSRISSVDQAIQYAEQIKLEGADIIDIGGEATHPKLDVSQSKVSIEEELDRVIPIVQAIKSHVDIQISVDTSKPLVMQEAVKAGAGMINDQRALTMPGALAMAASLNVPVCLMHMFGINREPNVDCHKTLIEIKEYLNQRCKAALDSGFKPENIIIDPGFGHGNYGKSTEENCYMLNHLEQLVAIGYPLMVGFSRKTFIGEILNLPIEERLIGSITAAILAAIKGAAIIRVHDVKETVQAIRVIQAVNKE
jgi:dihydropteroate synthase